MISRALLFSLALVFTSYSSFAATALPDGLVPLEKKFFAKAFQSYVAALSNKAPELKLDASTVGAPAFDATLSREAWIGSFSATVASSKGLSSVETEKLRAKSEDMFFSYFHNVAYARVPYLQVIDQPASGSPQVRSVENFNFPKAYPANHTLDVEAYVDERVPHELQDFLRKVKAAIFLEDSNYQDVLAYHRTQGFTVAIRFMGDRDTPESQFYVLFNPQSREYRLAISDLHGQDDLTRMVEIIGPAFSSLPAFRVNHSFPAPLFDFNDEGQALQIDAKRDIVVIGFQNTVWWQLLQSSSDWQRHVLTKSGTDVALFANDVTKQRVISIANVYGDEMREALTIAYARGARRFMYLGTAGGLDSSLRIGDVLMPSRFEWGLGAWAPFVNDAEKMTIALPNVDAFTPRLLHGTSQGWVPTLIEETRDHMQAMLADGAQALDVESRYFGEFTTQHPCLQKVAFVVISDTPLGATNYNQENLTRAFPMKMITALIPQIISAPMPARAPSSQAQSQTQSQAVK